MLNMVNPVAGLANHRGVGTAGGHANDLLRACVFPKSEGCVVPLVCIPVSKLRRVSGDDHITNSFGFAADFFTLSFTLQGGGV